MHTYTRLSIPMTHVEREALIAKSQVERRDPRDQAALEIRKALEATGYLPSTDGAGNGQYNPVVNETCLVT